MAEILESVSSELTCGYFQGLNQIAACVFSLFLSNSKISIESASKASILFLKEMLIEKKFERLIDNDLWLLHRFNLVLEVLMKQKMPETLQFFENVDFIWSIVSNKWLLTCFSYGFHEAFFRTIITGFLCQGFGVLFGFVLGLFETSFSKN